MESVELVDGFARATKSAAGIIGEIARRWPQQAGNWASDTAMAESWGRGILEAGVENNRELAFGLSKLNQRPFPPDLGAILFEIKKKKEISYEQAKISFEKTIQSVVSNQLHLLEPSEIFALKKFGGAFELIHKIGGTEDSVKKWRDFLNLATCQQKLPDRIEKPAGYIEKEINFEVIDAERKKIKAILKK